MARSDRPVAAVDIGGTKIIAAVFDGDGAVLSRIYCLTLAHEGPARVIKRLNQTIDRAIDKAGLQRSQVAGIGVAAAAIIDINRGLVTEAPNLPRWRNVPLPALISGEFNLPVYLLNDASAAALGEHRYGAGRGLNNLIYITVSTGIGGGIIIDGELYNGTDGCAAEIGHMVIMVDGPACNCGRRGCLESLASGTAIGRMARERLAYGETSIMRALAGNVIEDVTSVTVARAARKGDMLALDVIRTAAGYLGIGLANLVNILNPQMIIVGGGVSSMGAMLLGPARKSMKAHAFKLPASTVRIVRPALGMDAGLSGAAEYARRKGRIAA
jgi:glucokinase